MTPRETPQGALATFNRSRKTKRLNALTAILTGGLWAIATWALFPAKIEYVAAGFIGGLIWGNAFEYVYHRWILHLSGSAFSRRHMVHHRATGTPEEVEHLNFGESPLWIVLLIFVNGLPVFAFDRIFETSLAPGALLAFAVYYIAFEEIHWRIHLGERLPGLLEPARAFHLSHHDVPDARFSVFLPLFDWLLGTAHSRTVFPERQARPLH